MQKLKDTIEYALRELRGITLDDKVKARLRTELSTYADFHAAVLREDIPAAARTRGSFAWLSIHAWYRAGAALLAVLLLAGGTAYASDDALPGSPLYTVKVNIKEPIEVALAASPREKAEKHAKLAERRLEEATTLAVNASLTKDTQAYLEQEFGEHVDSSLAAADTLAQGGEEKASLDVRSHLESSLVAHADILDLVEDKLEEDGAEAAHTSTRNLVRAIKLRREVVSDTRVALERDLEDDATPSETLALVTEAAGSVTEAAKAENLRTVAEHVEESGDALAAAKESLKQSGTEDLRRAFRKAREAERASDVVSTLLKHRDILVTVDKPVAATTTTASTTTPQMPQAATTSEPVAEPDAPDLNKGTPKPQPWWSPKRLQE